MSTPSGTFPDRWSRWRVALSHDWLTGMRGGEQVLEVLCRGFDNAPIFTLIHNPAAISDVINSHPVHTSFLQRFPRVHRHYRYGLPIFPLAVKTLNPPPVDLILSTSHCVAKGIRRPKGARHICYCFTPMRYAWMFHDEYFGRSSITRLMVPPLLAGLRLWDRRTAKDVDLFIAISTHVQERIQRFYHRDARVVYPPVDTDFYTPDGRPRESFDLMVSALVPYKRIDLAVRTYTDKGWPLKIVGIGGELPKLRQIAGPTVEFLEWQSREAIRDLYRSCRCLIFPGEEDFGIVPLEAQACGAPVAAYAQGGALESIKDGVSGLFFNSQTKESLITAIEHLSRRQWKPDAIRAHAVRFSTQRFIAEFDAAIGDLLPTSVPDDPHGAPPASAAPNERSRS